MAAPCSRPPFWPPPTNGPRSGEEGPFTLDHEPAVEPDEDEVHESDDDSEPDEALADEDEAHFDLDDALGDDNQYALDGDDMPPLDNEAIADDDWLTQLVDGIIASNPDAQAAHTEILRHQDRLQDELTPEQWARVLELQRLDTARWADLILVIARWGYQEGVRHGRELP